MRTDQVQRFIQGAEATLPTAYYDIRSKEYLVQDERTQWLSLNEAQFKRVLLQNGISSTRDKMTGLSQIDHALLEYQQRRNVCCSGPLAGYQQGFYEMNSTRMLVTSSPKIIEPIEMDCTMLNGVIRRILILEDGSDVQCIHFYGWLKISYEALCSGQNQPGQVIAFCGPHGCGKSLLQRLITKILGGRVAKPYQAMNGSTAFNADLFGAEHLEIADEAPSTDIRARRAFGAQIKNITVNVDQRLHAKHRDALTLQPLWRMTVSLNDEQENLQILPPFDDSIVDKIMLFKTMPGVMPMPTGTPSERAAFEARMFSELPGFIYFLKNFEIPQEMVCQRFGIRHYHHPELLAHLNETAPELRLLALIERHFFIPGTQASAHLASESSSALTLSALEIETLLTASGSAYAREASRLLNWNNACGTYLGRLAKQFPNRITEHRTATERKWCIKPPQQTEI